jgi:hypothetical protein
MWYFTDKSDDLGGDYLVSNAAAVSTGVQNLSVRDLLRRSRLPPLINLKLRHPHSSIFDVRHLSSFIFPKMSLSTHNSGKYNPFRRVRNSASNNFCHSADDSWAARRSDGSALQRFPKINWESCIIKVGGKRRATLALISLSDTHPVVQ